MKLFGYEISKIKQKAAIPYQPGVKYSIQAGRLTTPPDNKTAYIEEGYNQNDIIFSIVNMILDKIVLPDWKLFKIIDENKLNEYNKLLTFKNVNYDKLLQLKSESLEPITNYNLQAGKLKELLKYPNEIDSFQDHNRILALYKLITGDYYELWDILNGGANKGVPNSLNHLPAHLVNISITNEFPATPVSYQLFTFNQSFTTQQVLHEKYPNPNYNLNGQQLYGFSPLKALLKNLNRNNSAKDASTAKFQNGGLDEIIYMDDQRYDAEQGLQAANALKIRLAEEYSGPKNQGKRAISGVKVGVAQLGLSPVDLGIIDSEKWDAIMFCNAYGVPPELLALAQKTFNNIREAEKALTTRSALPLLNCRQYSFNRKLQTDGGFKGVNIYAAFDPECFTELQTDITEVVAATSKMIMITPNEERELCNMDARPEPEADEPWVLSGNGRVPLSDYQANIVDQNLLNDLQGNNANGNGSLSSNGQGTNGMPRGNSANGESKVNL